MKSNVLFIAFTPYHLLCSSYYAIKIKKRFPNIRTTLIWQEYYGYCINIDFFKDAFDVIIEADSIVRNRDSIINRFIKRIFSGGILFDFSQVGKYINNNRCNNLVICFSDQDPSTYRILNKLRNKNNYVYLVEEGAGAYALDYVFRYSKKDYRYYLMLLYKICGVVHGDYIGYSELYDSWIVQNPQILPYVKKKGHIILQQNSIFFDETWTHKLINLNNSIMCDLATENQKKTLLWVGSPLEDCGVSIKEELNVLKEVINRCYNYNIIIKPHPRESKTKFCDFACINNVTILDNDDIKWIPVEYLFKRIKVDCVVTVISSAAKNMYDNRLTRNVLYLYKLFSSLQCQFVYLDELSTFEGAIIVNDINKIFDLPLNENNVNSMAKNYEDLDHIFNTIEGI